MTVHRPSQYAKYPNNCEFNKLVRDNVPQRLLDAGLDCEVVRIESNYEYDRALRAKVVEEASEVFEADTQENIIEEIADILESLEALADNNNIDWEHITARKNAKYATHGGFYGRTYLIRTMVKKDYE